MKETIDAEPGERLVEEVRSLIGAFAPNWLPKLSVRYEEKFPYRRVGWLKMIRIPHIVLIVEIELDNAEFQGVHKAVGEKVAEMIEEPFLDGYTVELKFEKRRDK